MAIQDGQLVAAGTDNPAFMSRLVDTSTIGKVRLERPASGSAVDDVQQLLNDHIAAIAQNIIDIAQNVVDIAQNAQNLIDHSSSTSGVHGVGGGDVVGTTISQLLTNKNLTSVTNSIRTATGAGSPLSITAAGGIPINGTLDEILYVTGDSPDVDVIVNPQVQAGTVANQQKLTIFGGPNTIILNEGDGLDINGICELGAGQCLQLLWDGTNWREISRRI